ncbi:hypothetical protein AYY19_07650 [Photobacterium aquimaris]|uniref:hypothetical protein n=1 Tax=Photobacterium aquimaris TaxID=512643 RepID=UPI0007EF5582|nr:hypothetical protein [Photobacterium aquimaris]OBU12785.1 hypothetical protein AYY19_07650 [Photobacterium aquimaris]PSW00832.1 hypothetical protein CTM91_11270 [Photobacterium aquimaris]
MASYYQFLYLWCFYCLFFTLPAHSSPTPTKNMHASVHYSQTIQPLTINTHIDNNYPIQLQLLFNVINCYDDIGLVTGWYQYDKYKVRMPLLGIYNYQFITLYRFDAVQHQRLLTQFKDHPSQLTTLENNSSFIEKFEFVNRWKQPNGAWLPFSGKWTNGTKTLNVNPFNMDSITDQAQNHYNLVITSSHRTTTSLDLLTQLGLASEYQITNGNIACPELSLAVANIKKNTQGWKIKLDYNVGLRRCAGSHAGYYNLQLDQQFKMISNQHVLVEQCSIGQ